MLKTLFLVICIPCFLYGDLNKDLNQFFGKLGS